MSLKIFLRKNQAMDVAALRWASSIEAEGFSRINVTYQKGLVHFTATNGRIAAGWRGTEGEFTGGVDGSYGTYSFDARELSAAIRKHIPGGGLLRWEDDCLEVGGHVLGWADSHSGQNSPPALQVLKPVWDNHGAIGIHNGQLPLLNMQLLGLLCRASGTNQSMSMLNLGHGKWGFSTPTWDSWLWAGAIMESPRR